jgi:hypothetical protein
MPFAPTDLLASVIAARPSRLTAACGLTIQNRSTRIRVATRCLPHLFPQSVMDLLPDSAVAPEPEIVIGDAPRRKVMRKQFPDSTTANDIEDAIEDFATVVFWWLATGFAGRYVSDSNSVSVRSVS